MCAGERIVNHVVLEIIDEHLSEVNECVLCVVCNEQQYDGHFWLTLAIFALPCTCVNVQLNNLSLIPVMLSRHWFDIVVVSCWSQKGLFLQQTLLTSCYGDRYAFSALTLLVGCKKSSDEVLAWFSLERGANDLHMIQLMPLPLHHLFFSLKSSKVLRFWYQLTQVVLEKRPLNGCISSRCGCGDRPRTLLRSHQWCSSTVVVVGVCRSWPRLKMHWWTVCCSRPTPCHAVDARWVVSFHSYHLMLALLQHSALH